MAALTANHAIIRTFVFPNTVLLSFNVVCRAVLFDGPETVDSFPITAQPLTVVPNVIQIIGVLVLKCNFF